MIERSSGDQAGLLLAGGTSQRFGESNKLVEVIGDEPMVRRAIRPFVNSSLDPVVMVVGYQAEKVRGAVSDMEVVVRNNPDYREGQSTSLRVGIEALEKREVSAGLIGLGDMPYLSKEIIERLLEAYRKSPDRDIVVPVYRSQRGNPVLFDRTYFEELKAIEGDRGGRTVISRNEVYRVPVETRSILRDVDVPQDLD